MWLIHIDVWFNADPQKIIDLIPEDIKPYVVFNLSLSCSYDTSRNVYKMPQNAVLTYKSWGSVCSQNNVWFTCQPASGGHTHIKDNDLETFEYFFKNYKNFLGWNYAEQFWGFDEPGDLSSSKQTDRWELFGNLVEMSHRYGGVLIESFCGNIWSHPLNPIGQLKRNNKFYKACKAHPENVLFLYKYTTSSCWYNNESVTMAPFISGFATNYGVRYDNCGWNGAVSEFDKRRGNENRNRNYPHSVGIAPVMEQTALNGACVWDGPELTWTESMHEVNQTTIDGYQRRNWSTYTPFDNIWMDLFRKIIDGTLYIPTREEVVARTKIAIISDISASSDDTSLKRKAYATPETLYNGLYKQDDPLNDGDGNYMNNMLYFKRTGRYQAIPLLLSGYDDVAATIPNKPKMSTVLSNARWTNQTAKMKTFNDAYPEEYTGDLFAARHYNEWITYYPFSYYRKVKTASASIPFRYNTCEKMELTYTQFSSGIIREYADHLSIYLNNFRADSTTLMTDVIKIYGAKSQPTFTFKNRSVNKTISGKLKLTDEWVDGVYTLNVKHLGPVDITIQCEGDHTSDRQEDYLPEGVIVEPEQPEPYYGEVIIEAENLDFKDVGKVETNPYAANPSERGHSAMGYVDMGTKTTAALRGYFNAPYAGDYLVKLRYTSSKGSTSFRFSANGTAQKITLDKTAEMNDWQEAELTVSLKEGENSFIIRAIANSKNMYFDYVSFTPVDAPPADAIIANRASATTKVIARYSLSGTRLHQPVKGVNILKMSDGTVRKVLVR